MRASCLSALAVSGVLAMSAIVVAAGAAGGVGSAVPYLTIAPSSPFADREIVAVSGSGFTPHHLISVKQCEASTKDALGCENYTYRVIDPSDDGAFVTTLRIHTQIPVAGQTVDCSQLLAACSIAAFEDDGLPPLASVPINIDTSLPPLPRPAISIVPAAHQTDGQAVQISGDGFAPGVDAGAVVCETVTAHSGYSCSEAGARLAVDNYGHVAGVTHVQQAFTVVTPKGTVHTDCGTIPGTCSLFVRQAKDTEVAVQLDFSPEDQIPADTAPAGEDGRSGPNELARTGFDASGIAAVGVLLVLCGSTSLACARRRRGIDCHSAAVHPLRHADASHFSWPEERCTRHNALGVDCLACGARDDRPIQVQAARAWSMAVSMLVGS